MSADGADGEGGPAQKFELYIKASSIDKETKGSCPICQHWFMLICELGARDDNIDFKVFTVQAECPPKNFGGDDWSKKFPVLRVLSGRDKKGQDISGMKFDTTDELETYLDNININCRELKRKNEPNLRAMAACENVYSAFCKYISNKNHKPLIAELKKIDEFMQSEETKFLVDDVLSFSDCYLLPRLQHIRVAGKAYLDFDIPFELKALWKYLREAYKTEAFRSTMPSDQDIILHYEKKATNPPLKGKWSDRPTLQQFTYTMDIPPEVGLDSDTDNGDVSQQMDEE